MNTFTLYPTLPRATSDHATVTMQAGRFTLDVLVHRRVPTGGLEWTVRNEDDVRHGDRVPLSGRIAWSALAAEEILYVVTEFARYSEHLDIEEAIQANPERYRKEAEKLLKAEQVEAEKARKAAEAEAKAAAKAAEAEAKAAADAEQAEADAAAEAERAREQAEKQARLDAMIRNAAARELGVA